MNKKNTTESVSKSHKGNGKDLKKEVEKSLNGFKRDELLRILRLMYTSRAVDYKVMNLLTIVATIFIPLTYLAGIFGMNFDPQASPYNMPELGWRYGYLGFWAVTIVLVIGMLALFRSKGWIGGGRSS